MLLLIRHFRSTSVGGTGAARVSSSSPLRAPKAAGSRVSDVDPNKPRVRLLYGTQTGTAERFCKHLCKELKGKYGESTLFEVLDMENYAPSRLQREKLLVLCAATYGDGEPTDNATEFLAWLVQEAQAVEAGEQEPSLTVSCVQQHAEGCWVRMRLA